MSTTVDDLVISLTIKEGGNLDKLRKQLKAIVGEKGEKKKLDFGKLDPSIKKDLDWIKHEISFIAPGMIPGSGDKWGLAKTGKKYLKWVRERGGSDNLAERVIPKLDKDIKAMKIGLGLDADASMVELKETLVDIIDKDWIEKLKAISLEQITGEEARDILLVWNKIQGSALATDKERKMLFSAMQTATKENNRLLLSIFKKKGIQAMFEPKFREFLPAVAEQLSHQFFQDEQGHWRNYFDEMLNENDMSPEDFKKAKKAISDFQNELTRLDPKSSMGYFNFVADKLGLDSEEAMKATMAEIQADWKKRVLAAAMIFGAVERGGGIPSIRSRGAGGSYTHFAVEKMLPPYIPPRVLGMDKYTIEGMFTKLSKIDFALFNASIEKLKEFNLEALGDKLVAFIEQKVFAGPGIEDQVNRFLRVYGSEFVGIIAESISPGLLEEMPDLKTGLFNVWKEAVESGVKAVIPDEAIKKFQELAESEVTMEKLRSGLEIIISMVSGVATEEQMNSISGMVEDIVKGLGSEESTEPNEPADF